jgi:hypothetical protein
MKIVLSPRFQSLPLMLRLFLVLSLTLICQLSWAAQDAIVVADEAVIYSDEKMSSPIGFVRKGKRIKVGEIPRNKAQVYPVIVSGRMAFIRVGDVDTTGTGGNPGRVAERFLKNAEQPGYQWNVGLSYVAFMSKVGSVPRGNRLANNDPFTWTGFSFKAEVLGTERVELQFLTNYLSGESGAEMFRMVEMGFGGAYRIFDRSRFILKLELQGMAIPFSSYQFGNFFRVNGHGGTIGGGASAAMRLGRNLGIEVFGGPYYTILSGLQVPQPAQTIRPSFFGTRFGLGLNYRY